MNVILYFWIFLKASLLSFGGLGNLPFLHQDLISLGWAREADFINAIAVGQLSPGPSGLWSISLGYLTFGWAGSMLALFAILIPPLLSMAVNSAFQRIENQSNVRNFSRGLMLGVIGLSLGVTWTLSKAIITGWKDLLIVLAAFSLALSQRVPVILILFLAAVAGILFYSFG